MSNLEELTFYMIIQNRTAFIDGIHIYNEILVHVPRLHLFSFRISTDTKRGRLVRHLSKDNIQRSFTNIMYQQIDYVVHYQYSRATCHVFSLPCMLDNLRYIGNTFLSIIFSRVTSLAVHDDVPFKHEFFIRTAWSFPLRNKLCVINLEPQSSISTKRNSNGNQLYSVVKYHYLISLDLGCTHIDYVEQFLNETKIYLLSLIRLIVDCDFLIMVTKNLTRETTRLNCINVKQLIIDKTIVQHAKDFYVYFPLLGPCFCSDQIN
jgi:hypothetical protein